MSGNSCQLVKQKIECLVITLNLLIGFLITFIFRDVNLLVLIKYAIFAFISEQKNIVILITSGPRSDRGFLQLHNCRVGRKY